MGTPPRTMVETSKYKTVKFKDQKKKVKKEKSRA